MTRMAWWEAPRSLQKRIQRTLGSKVAVAETQAGGFSPGVAALCHLENGRTVFVKACGSSINATTARLHLHEATVLEQLRRAAFVPTLIDVVEDADWIALITVGAPGRLPTARDASGIDRMLALIPRIQAISTEQFPSTVDTAFAHLQISPWADMSADDPAPDPWVRRNLERLLELERQASSLDPEVVCHGDFRLDNVLFTANGRTMLVDWAQASTGPVFADLVEACIDIEVAGGARASTTFSSHAPIAIADSDDAVNAHLAGVAGRLTRMSGFPEPPGTTHVRAFQRQQAACARAWLSERLA